MRKLTLFSVCIASLFTSAPLFAALSAKHLYTVQPQTITQPLYYSGTISPIVNTPVTSPTQGVVTKMAVSYGQMVKKGQLLLEVSTKKLENQVRSARVDYLNAQEKYNKLTHWQTSNDILNALDSVEKAQRALKQAQNTYQENQKLFKYGIISHNELIQSKNSLADSQSSLQQAQRSLDNTKAQSQGDNLTTAQLQLDNAKEKYQSLLKQTQHSKVYAPASGIILQPSNDQTSGGGAGKATGSGKVDVGSSIDYQQVLMNIGDMSGLTIKITIPEDNINMVKPGLKATITGSGFSGITLQGHVSEVGAQANSDGGGMGSVPTFPAKVKVPHLTAHQKAYIRSGMDAQVAIMVYKKSGQLTVPIVAVGQNTKKQSVVKLYNAQTGSITITPIETGKTLPQKVQVLSGLKSGEQIVTPYSFELNRH